MSGKFHSSAPRLPASLTAISAHPPRLLVIWHLPTHLTMVPALPTNDLQPLIPKLAFPSFPPILSPSLILSLIGTLFDFSKMLTPGMDFLTRRLLP